MVSLPPRQWAGWGERSVLIDMDGVRVYYSNVDWRVNFLPNLSGADVLILGEVVGDAELYANPHRHSHMRARGIRCGAAFAWAEGTCRTQAAYRLALAGWRPSKTHPPPQLHPAYL